MINLKYEIDGHTEITVSLGTFGGKTIVNGKQIREKIKLKNKVPFNFNLDDGRSASATYSNVAFRPEVEVRVNNELMLPTTKETKKNCVSCKTENKPNDKFCTKCGAGLPSAEAIVGKQKVAGARGAIMTLAVLFTIFGAIMFFVEKSTADKAMTNLTQFQDSDIYPEKVDGQQYTVGELKNQIVVEQWSVLILNLLLAAIMLGLWFWAKTAPLPAIIIASAVYGVVLVGNAIYEPQSIGKGWIMKFIIITMLFNGIKSALAARHAKTT